MEPSITASWLAHGARRCIKQAEQSTQLAAVMSMEEMPEAFWGRGRALEMGRRMSEGIGVKIPFTLDIYNSFLGSVDPHDVLRPSLPWQQAEDMLR